jgi:hypothetical protein
MFWTFRTFLDIFLSIKTRPLCTVLLCAARNIFHRSVFCPEAHQTVNFLPRVSWARLAGFTMSSLFVVLLGKSWQFQLIPYSSSHLTQYQLTRVSKTEHYCLSRICFRVSQNRTLLSHQYALLWQARSRRHAVNWAENVVDEQPIQELVLIIYSNLLNLHCIGENCMLVVDLDDKQPNL